MSGERGDLLPGLPRGGPLSIAWFHLLDPEQIVARPASPVSPVQQKVLQKGKLTPVPRIGWVADGDECTVLAAAARKGVVGLSQAQIRKLMKLLGVQLAGDG